MQMALVNMVMSSMLMCVHVADAMPHGGGPGLGLFALAGLNMPVVAMQPGDARDVHGRVPWTPPVPPATPLGEMRNADGISLAFPATLYDGLGLLPGEMCRWFQPLLLVAMCSVGLLGSTCQLVNLTTDHDVGMNVSSVTYCLCQATCAALSGMKMQEFMTI